MQQMNLIPFIIEFNCLPTGWVDKLGTPHVSHQHVQRLALGTGPPTGLGRWGCHQCFQGNDRNNIVAGNGQYLSDWFYDLDISVLKIYMVIYSHLIDLSAIVDKIIWSLHPSVVVLHCFKWLGTCTFWIPVIMLLKYNWLLYDVSLGI